MGKENRVNVNYSVPVEIRDLITEIVDYYNNKIDQPYEETSKSSLIVKLIVNEAKRLGLIK